MRVLYVDDDAVNTLLFTEACRMTGGIELQTAATGAEALAAAAGLTPELLVIDLRLPDTTGFALLPRLREALASPALPAFLCTADDAAEVEEPARTAGFDGCWTKPVNIEHVMAELARRRGRP